MKIKKSTLLVLGVIGLVAGILSLFNVWIFQAHIVYSIINIVIGAGVTFFAMKK